MLKKIKNFLLCSGIVLGASACSSDNSPANKQEEGEDYVVTVTTTDGGLIEATMAVIYEGKDEKKDIVQEIKTSEWIKKYRMTETKKLSFTAQGIGADSSSKMKVVLTKNGEILEQGASKGTALSTTLVYSPKKEKPKAGK